jgi:hypothetical protein
MATSTPTSLSVSVSSSDPFSLPEANPTPLPKPRSSNLRLLPCDPLTDGPAILSQQIAAFSNPIEPFFFVLYPPTEKFENAVKRTVDRWLADAGAKYVKVVDERGECDISVSVAERLLEREAVEDPN